MSQPMHILLVEDTPSDIRLTQEALKDCGEAHCRLSIVHDGVEAMEFINKVAGTTDQPDLILLDLNMPRMNGHQVLAELGQMDAMRTTPVILLTVSQDEHDIMQALKVKMNYYLSKPVDGEKLGSLLRAMRELSANEMVVQNLRGEDAHVRYVIAGNPHTQPEVLARLAVERNATIRKRVAENPNTPVAVLNLLVEDPKAEVRSGIGENTNAPLRLLERLAKDTNDDVRLAVASNPRVPVELLRRLSVDQNAYVMAAAQKTLDAIGAGWWKQ